LGDFFRAILHTDCHRDAVAPGLHPTIEGPGAGTVITDALC